MAVAFAVCLIAAMAVSMLATRRYAKRPKPLQAADALDAVLRSPQLRAMLSANRRAPQPEPSDASAASTRSWPSTACAPVLRQGLHPDHAACIKDMRESELSAKLAAEHQKPTDARSPPMRKATAQPKRAPFRSPRMALLDGLQLQQELDISRNVTRALALAMPNGQLTPPLPDDEASPMHTSDAKSRSLDFSSLPLTLAAPMKLVDAPPSSMRAAAIRSSAQLTHARAAEAKERAAVEAASRVASAKTAAIRATGARRVAAGSSSSSERACQSSGKRRLQPPSSPRIAVRMAAAGRSEGPLSLQALHQKNLEGRLERLASLAPMRQHPASISRPARQVLRERLEDSDGDPRIRI